MNQNNKKHSTNSKNTQHVNPTPSNAPKKDTGTTNSVHKSGAPGIILPVDVAIAKMADPTLAASARVSMAASTSINTMCEVIKGDNRLSTDDKLQRLQHVNEIEQGNKEQAHRMAMESATQQGILTIFAIVVVGIGILLSRGSDRVKLPKVA